MTDASADLSKWSMVGKDPWTMPIEKIDLSHPGIWQANQFLPFICLLYTSPSPRD